MVLDRYLISCSIVLCVGVVHAAPRITYCCTDERGVAACGDVLPAACQGRAYREINERGVTVRRVDAPLTSEQRAQKDVEARRRQEEARVREEERRRDQALLASYSSEKDIDYLRDRRVADLEDNIRKAQERVEESLKRKKTLEQQLAAKGRHAKDAADALRENESALHSHRSVVEAKQRELDAVKAKYDDEKRRFVELTRGSATAGSASGSLGGR